MNKNTYLLKKYKNKLNLYSEADTTKEKLTSVFYNKEILFYGNCQTNVIKETLGLGSEYYIYNIQCWTTNINKEEFTNIIKKCNVIITQPINDNYRNLDYLSTQYIINNSNKDCKIIIFDSCYFSFYYFDLTYINFNNEILHQPIDYHYNKLIECYKNNKPIEYYINNFVNNVKYKTDIELDLIIEDNLNNILTRYNINLNKYNKDNVHIISSYEFIKNNYKDKLLFYSMNHPSKYLIQFICENIIQILNIPNTINYNIDLFNHTRCILYKCIQKKVNFNITEYTPLILNNSDIRDIINLYYNTYKNINYV